MKKITAKFPSRCADTGDAIATGDTVYYDTGLRKVITEAAYEARILKEVADVRRMISVEANPRKVGMLRRQEDRLIAKL